MAKMAITKPATGSSQAAPVSANRPSPANVAMLISTQIRVSAASARISGSLPSRVATSRFARTSRGITTMDNASSTRPTGDLSGTSPATRSSDAFDDHVGSEQKEGHRDQPQGPLFTPYVGLTVAQPGGQPQPDQHRRDRLDA